MTTEENRSKNHSLIHVEPFQKDTLSIADYLTSKFDYVVSKNMYKPHDNTLAVYSFLREIMIDKKTQIKTPILTLSPDPSISASTIAGVAEKFMYNDIEHNKTVFNTSLHVLYIDSLPDLSTLPYSEYDDFRNSVLSDVMGLTENSFSNHRVNIRPDNITLVGINEEFLDDEQNSIITQHNIDMYGLELMKKKGIERLMMKIVDKLQDKNIHIVIDLSCIQQCYAPSVIRDVQKLSKSTKDIGFTYEEIEIIVKCLKQLKNINSIDITGYHFGLQKDKETHYVSNMITIKTIEMIINNLIELKQKSINFFNENSKFLIWRKVDDVSTGWYILRGMSLQQREELIREFEENEIKLVPICENETDNEDNDSVEDDRYEALVTVTTFAEQQSKSYYTSSSIHDCCLFPGEKVNMMFELLNTPQQLKPLDSEQVDQTEHKVDIIQIQPLKRL